MSGGRETSNDGTYLQADILSARLTARSECSLEFLSHLNTSDFNPAEDAVALRRKPFSGQVHDDALATYI